MNRTHINLLIHRLVDTAVRAARAPSPEAAAKHIMAATAVSEALDAVEAEIQDLKFDIENAHE